MSVPAHRQLRWRLAIAALSLSTILRSGISGQPAAPSGPSDGERHYDRRLTLEGPVPLAVQPPAHSQALAALQQQLPSLAVTFDSQSGATRTISNRAGYLSPPDGRTPVEIALAFVGSGNDLLGLEPADLADLDVTDVVRNVATGSSHVYLRQAYQRVPVYNAQIQVNVNRDGRITSVSNQFVRGLSQAVSGRDPAVAADQAVVRAAVHLNRPLRRAPAVAAVEGDQVQTTTVEAADLSLAPVRAALMYLPIRAGDVRLVWNFQVQTTDGQHAYDFTVDAASGDVWTRFDWTAGDHYKVYPAAPQPVQSPSHAAPGDALLGRQFISNPADTLASPFGWHDTNGAIGPEFLGLRGNNAHAYADRSNLDVPPASEPTCGSNLQCEFPLDLTLSPASYLEAALTNLFYWTNIVHDVQYRYGFTEAAGNFQLNNYGRGGFGFDEVWAEAQDGADVGRVSNANFTTPPDGNHPRMQMFEWNTTSPRRDGSFDASVIVHEYAHGISNRLVGGPSNVSCLANRQQPGEGISDWLALVYTARTGDTAAMGRGIATYVLGQDPDGMGLRSQRYSTDPSVNSWTYASINGMSVPHGVGSVWAQAMWEVYWGLVGTHGFDPNLYDASGGAGNQRALLYFTEGLMNTPCSPTFTDMRDALLQAAFDNHGGVDYCPMWRSFAGFGLGADAVSGGPDTLAVTNGFGVPGACAPATAPTVTINDVIVNESRSIASFTVFLSVPTSVPVTVRYATADGTAVSTDPGGDYTSATGSIVIPPGAFARPIDIALRNDTAPEPRETFTVTLTSSVNAPIGDGQGRGTIVDDDEASVFANPFEEIAADLGLAGLWLGSNILSPTPSWAQLHPFNPLDIASGDLDGNDRTDVIVNFAGAGLWVWANGTTWSNIHPFNSTATAVGDLDGNGLDDVVFNFPGYGVYAYMNQTLWQRIFYLDAIGLAVANLDNDAGGRADLLINIQGDGVWAWMNNSAWAQIAGPNPSLMAVGDTDGNGQDDVVMNFPGGGIWAWTNNAGWSYVHWLNATHIALGNIDGDPANQADIVVDLPGYGIWTLRNRVEWLHLQPANATHLRVADLDSSGAAEVILTAPRQGSWALVNFRGWLKLTDVDAESFAGGRIDER